IGETAIFAWCMSKAWSSKIGNGAVYYVTRSQVSKTPESGEYLARGAWIIRGKKNYISHLSLELAIGFQRYENREYVVSAPVSAIKGKKVLIHPGEAKEKEVSEIAEFLKVEKEAIYPVLPPGGISIVEKVEN
ncbi:MAG: fibronectin-binding domain-containing protein, partial [Thermoplasmatales archaeon]